MTIAHNNTPTNYGANPGDWCHWSFVLGLTADLLPVVSNPNAIISETSKLKDLGKTPSSYIGNQSAKRVVGIPGWTAKQSIEDEVERWSDDDDLGICLQTREVRAIDVDVTDEREAGLIHVLIESMVGILPKRHRDNSSKFALALTLPGEMPKRKIITEHGIIEFLATGQQFIVSGTHPSGARYQWAPELPLAIPKLTLDQFNALWGELERVFATEPSSESRGLVKRKSGDSFETDDIVRDFIVATRLDLSYDRDGSISIECPWNDQHTSGSVGDSSTVYFPAGSKGYERGHFRCLHGHCENRLDEEFIEALNIPAMSVIDMFEVIPQRFIISDEGITTTELVREMPAFARVGNSMVIKSTLDNLRMALERFDFSNVELSFDDFKGGIMVKLNQDERRPIRNEDYTEIRMMLEQRGFMPISKESIKDMIDMISNRNHYDSAILWINSLLWDGVPRIEMFNHTHLGAEDTPYTRAVATYMWTAFAGRVLVPGIKADMAPVLFSAQQGKYKSTAVSAMAPSKDEFLELSFNQSEADMARKMRGKMVIELAEMSGFKGKEAEATKAIMSSPGAEIVPKFKEVPVYIARRGLFVATTNDDSFLSDPTGARRLLPFEVGIVRVDMIQKDLLQLWAEASHTFKAQGIVWKHVESYMHPEHEKFRSIDPWESLIFDWLYVNDPLSGQLPSGDPCLTTAKILIRALGKMPCNISKQDEHRISNIMKELKFSKSRKQVLNERNYIWSKNT